MDEMKNNGLERHKGMGVTNYNIMSLEVNDLLAAEMQVVELGAQNTTYCWLDFEQ